MMYYDFTISSKPKNKHVKWATIVGISHQNKIPEKIDLRKVLDQVKEVTLEIKQEPGKKERPYPDFLSVDVYYKAVNQKAKKFLLKNNINFDTLPTKIKNSDIQYELVFFKSKDCIDFEKSNAELNKETLQAVTKGKTYFSSDLVLDGSKLENQKGIFHIKYLGSAIICDEETKKDLEKSKLTGFYFQELEVSN